MSDDLVNRLQTLSHPASESLPDGKRLTLLILIAREAADVIERLTRERDDAHQRYVDANEARIDAEKSLTDAYMAGAADARKELDSARVTMSEAALRHRQNQGGAE